LTSEKLSYTRTIVTILLAFIIAFPILIVPIQKATAQTTHYVTISGFAFDPQNLTIKQEDTVMWTNNDPVIHTLWFVRISDGSTYLLSEPILPDTTWTYTFNDVEELQYYSFDKLWITGFINVLTAVHDIAVTAVETFKTVCGKTFHPIDIVYENYTVSINATVENQGDFSETFDVVAKYDGNIIQTIVGVSLAAHTSKNVTFTWDTHGVAKGSYTITVEAVLPTDVDPGDNTKTHGPVKVTWLGDLDGDFDVDEDDLWAFCDAFIDYWRIHVKDPLCDFDDDCDIDEDDLWTFCEAFIDYWKSRP